MVKLVVFTFLFLTVATAQGARIISFPESQPLAVPKPTVMVLCEEKLWVYSKEKKNFSVFDSTRLTLLGEAKIPKHQEKEILTSGVCRKGEMILAFLAGSKSSSLRAYQVFRNELVSVSKNLSAPEKSLVTDMSCANADCVALVSGKVFRTTDFQHWVHIPVRVAPDVKNIEVDTDSNPFDGWQDKLILSKGRYTKIMSLPEGKFALLDPLRTSVIIAGEKTESLRWGKWGAWEGYLLSPKDFTLFNGKYILISDPALKVVSMFDLNGRYLGLLGQGSNLADFQYPSHLVATETLIFVSDLLGDRVRVFQRPSAYHLKDTTDDFTRVNLFRRSEVLKDRIKNRCLLCHDGTLADDSDKYFHSKTNHPVGIEAKEKTDLSLAEGNILTCATCHDPHHKGDNPHLRKKPLELCTSCHKAKLDRTQNHDDLKGNNCLNCHTPHAGEGHALKQSAPALCMKCHGDKKFEHRSVGHIMSTDRAKNLRFENDQITCLTCHSPHGGAPGESQTFCASCHGEKAGNLFSQFHKRIKRR